MTTLINEKASGGNPRLNPNTPLYEDSSLFDEPSKGDTDSSQLSTIHEETLYYEAILPYGEIVEGIAAPNATRDFNSVTHETLSLFFETGVSHCLALWLKLHEAQYTKDGRLHLSPRTWTQLAEETQQHPNTVRAQALKLQDAGFLEIIPQRQTVSPGTSRKAGNCFLLNYRKPSKKETVNIVLSASTYKTVSTESTTSTGTTSTFNAEARGSISSQNTVATPQQTVSSLYLDKDLYKDLFKAKQEKQTSEKIGTRATENQLNKLERFLGQLKPAALRLYGVNDLSELTQSQASDLMKHTLGENPELTQRLNNEHKALKAQKEAVLATEQAKLQDEARQEQERLDAQARQSEITEHGHVLSVQERAELGRQILKGQR